MATKKQIEGWIKQLQKRMDGVAAERDKIDDALDELGMMKDTCDRAYENLQDARDALSELV